MEMGSSACPRCVLTRGCLVACPEESPRSRTGNSCCRGWSAWGDLVAAARNLAGLWQMVWGLMPEASTTQCTKRAHSKRRDRYIAD